MLKHLVIMTAFLFASITNAYCTYFEPDLTNRSFLKMAARLGGLEGNDAIMARRFHEMNGTVIDIINY